MSQYTLKGAVEAAGLMLYTPLGVPGLSVIICLQLIGVGIGVGAAVGALVGARVGEWNPTGVSCQVIAP